MTSPPPLDTLLVTVEERSGALVGRIHGPLDLATAPVLEAELSARLAESSARRLLLDMSDVPFLSCQRVAVLVRFAHRCRGPICLAGLSGCARRALQLVEVVDLFDLRESIDSPPADTPTASRGHGPP